MRPVLLVGLDPRQRFPQELSGPFRIDIAGEQHSFGERQLVAITAGQHVQMNMRHRVEGGQTVVQRGHWSRCRIVAQTSHGAGRVPRLQGDAGICAKKLRQRGLSTMTGIGRDVNC